MNNNIEMVEYHVDDHVSFQEACKHLPYGGHLSVRKDPNSKPLMINGQDEVIFRQNTFTGSSWTLPDGTKQLLPKDDGQGLVLSSFCSRELGYGWQIPPDILREVNVKRKGKKYDDEKAAIMKNGTAFKAPLVTTPFVRELEYGNSHNGYWVYENMVLQLEDCVDVLKITNPEFDFLFLFDYSNGHDCLQPNGLNINKISVRFGGKQPHMRSTTLTSNLLGPFHSTSTNLQVGTIQSLQFSHSDPGPCYLSPADRISFKFDRDTGRIRTKDLVKKQLIENLKVMKGVAEPTGTKEKLKEQCANLGLPTSCQERIIQEGWAGKQKGSLQVLYERGWVNPDLIRFYTLDGREEKEGDTVVVDGKILDVKDPTGCSFSIKKLLKLQSDFVNELTLLQFHAKRIGVEVDRTPKCHPEIAGEGIEYAWALSKLSYRRAPLSKKRNRLEFKN